MNTDDIYQPGTYKFEVPASVHLVSKNGAHRIVRMGFCWPGFLLPVLWAMSEGLWRPFGFSLIFFFAAELNEATVSYCGQTGSCATAPFAAAFTLAGFVCYIATMGYFGYKGNAMLVADLLKHGYFVEGSPHPVESDACES